MTLHQAPPILGAAFFKAHGLGNDYLVFEEGASWSATPTAVSLVCDPHRGVGSDGIVVLLKDRSDGVLRLRMFNPDGSEFERSGNGLRVLAAYAESKGLAESPFVAEVGGDRIVLSINPAGADIYDISVEMGRARLGPGAIQLDEKVLDESGRLEGPSGEPLDVVLVSIGNPHIVVLTDDPSDSQLHALGPFLVAHPALAHGTNVQRAAPIDSASCRALIWERGVGPTSASGTSSCAVAVAMVERGFIAPGHVRVRMPGGEFEVTVSEDFDVLLRGPVEEVCNGQLSDQLLSLLNT